MNNRLVIENEEQLDIYIKKVHKMLTLGTIIGKNAIVVKNLLKIIKELKSD